MQADNEWDLIRPERSSPTARARAGILRVSLLFGLIAIALTLFVTPFLEDRARPILGQLRLDGLDYTATGSVSRTNTYTLRRSVLQETPQSVCVIHPHGEHTGDC
ncbi:hypothetical protein [Aminobacter sp. MDW-2]|uniref:hypothetical protein n=1 Tax=Aminobacter sp. MDW-2 TaxID=2666139 RepID=UPI0012B00378|nr:hypothetical protein [Aminobacter sp. MDW-2]MRX35204.1 hypothetical protein [Aminobacter sp. MDW-2]QNH36143.1 hypothetical protein H5P29_09760 [Aminobacter sp. MDW-2]